jgi:hypothetical protein
MGYDHDGEDCVVDSHYHVLGHGRDHHPGFGPASLGHIHSWARLDDVKQESRECSMQEEVSEIANDGGTDQGVISQPRGSHFQFHCGHVILLVSHPNHSEHLGLNSGP